MFDFMDAMGNDFGIVADSFTAGGGMPGSTNPMDDVQQALMMEQMNQTPVNNMQGTVQGMPGKVSSTSVDEIQQMLPTSPYQQIGGGEGAGAKGSGIFDGGDIFSKMFGMGF
jgi:hypothetical protein